MTIPNAPESSAPLPRMIIGSRASPLALAQTRWVENALRAAVPGAEPVIHLVKTRGDRFQSALLASGTTVGLFVRELEEELLAGRIDLAVHSLKDLPTSQPPGLTLAAIPVREDPRDVLVVREGAGLSDLPPGARVGTGSPRRVGQLRAVRRDLRCEPIRGNVDTRIRKLLEGEVEALVLAAAGLKRLAVEGAILHPLPFETMLPAPGQGALAVEIRSEDRDLGDLLRRHLNHRETRVEVSAERALLKALGGGCQMPVGSLGRVEGEQLILAGVVTAPDGSRVLRDEVRRRVLDPEASGFELGERMLEAGARGLLAAIERRGDAP